MTPKPQYPNPLIISVKSRKGGVGKTTAALNLADILQRKRSKVAGVLVLDLDITGTDVTEGLSSGFWRKVIHILHPPGTQCDDKPANLLDLFANGFMCGDGIPTFTFEHGAPSSPGLHIEPSPRINVLGSCIRRASETGGAGVSWLSRPELLFDELHAFWFVEFIRQLAHGFSQAVAGNGRRGRACVVLDNASGYAGLVPALEEWLTDIGPRLGKFLTVSSLDAQDIDACGAAIDDLHALCQKKWSTTLRFREARDSTSPDSLRGDGLQDKDFFIRLVEAESRDSGGTAEMGISLAFYLGDDFTLWKEYDTRPELYQGLILNRVPSAAVRDDASLLFSLVDVPDDCIWPGLLKSGRGDPRDFMVPYDEYIEYQFAEEQLRRTHDRRGSYVGSMIRGTWLASLPSESDAISKLAYIGPIPKSAKWLVDTAEDLWSYQNTLRGAAEGLGTNGMGDLAGLIRDEWYPRGWIRDMTHQLRSAAASTGIPFLESGFRDSAFLEEGRLLYRAHQRVFRDAYAMAADVADAVVMVERFLPSLLACAMLATGSFIWEKSELSEALISALGAIGAVEALAWESADQEEPGESRGIEGIVEFLARQSMTRPRHAFKAHRLHGRLRTPPEELAQLYCVCAYSQARLLDSLADTRFLLLVLARLAEFREEEDALIPDVRGIVEPVLVEKRMPHEEGERRLSQSLSGASSMRELQIVLKRVTDHWKRDL